MGDNMSSQGNRLKAGLQTGCDPQQRWRIALEEFVQAMRDCDRADRTVQSYTGWARKFQAFVRSRPPDQLSTEDVKAFLTHLAVDRDVAASTQNQAFNALLFFFRNALGKEFGKVDGVVRAKRRPYIPVVLSRREVDLVIDQFSPPHDLMVKLLYGCGLRISECLDLRVHCFNVDDRVITVHDGMPSRRRDWWPDGTQRSGAQRQRQKDRTVPLPERVVPAVLARFDELRQLHERDLATEGFAGVFLPKRLEVKFKNAPREFIWQWFFPAPRLTKVPATGEFRRYHVQRSHVHHTIKQAARKAAITKRVTAHTFRHTFASHLLQAGYDIRTIQGLLGHRDVKTTMIYTHTVPSITIKEARSPLDL